MIYLIEINLFNVRFLYVLVCLFVVFFFGAVTLTSILNALIRMSNMYEFSLDPVYVSVFVFVLCVLIFSKKKNTITKTPICIP